MSQIYTDKLLMTLPNIFNAKTAFSGALAKLQITDGITDGTKAFTVKRSQTPVVINNYDTTKSLNSGQSRFGDVNEVTYGVIDVNYDTPYALNEAIDKFTVKADENQAIADRHELQGIALTRRSNARLGAYLSAQAGQSVELTDYTAEKVAQLFNTVAAAYTDNEVDGNLYAYVTPTLFNAMVDLIQFKSLTGATVDVNNNKLINYKGFTVESTPSRYFSAGDVAYFTAEGIVIPFMGIEFSRTIEYSNFAGQLLQTAVKAGQYLQEENKPAVVKATIKSGK
ncbi:phage capsid protein [Leuconostoc citreum]|uniref:phage capsid protein n=1 Tax=Leuconostoc citreum TaxID=33964 RepID=UPI0032DFF71F